MPLPAIHPRWRFALALIAATFALGWSGLVGWRTYQLSVVQTAMDRWRFQAAARAVSNAERLGTPLLTVLRYKIRLARRRGSLQSLSDALDRAEAAGATWIAKERSLSSALLGETASAEGMLVDLFNDVDIPVRDVCECLANGFLIQYRRDDATKLIARWKLEAPRDPSPDFILGRIAVADRRRDDARVAFERAITLEPNYPAARYQLGLLDIAAQKLADALKQLELAAEGLETPVPAQVRIAETQRILGRLDLAKEWLERADAWEKGDLVDEAWKIVGENSEIGATAIDMERGRLALVEDRYDVALAAFDRVLEKTPRQISVQVDRATALRKLGRLDESEEQIRRIQATREATARGDELMHRVEKSPRDPQPRFEMGKLLLEHVSERQGLVWLNSALAIDPDFEPAHRALWEHYSTHANRPNYRELANRHFQRLMKSSRTTETSQP